MIIKSKLIMTLCLETIDQNELNVVLRDLSSHESLDVKELFAEYKKEEKDNKKKKKSKADEIIRNNMSRRKQEQINRDLERLEYFRIEQY